MNGTREGKCECCDRHAFDISGHHLIPKTKHKNKRIKRLFTKDERNKKVDVCQPCHKAFHTFFTEKELAINYNTLDKLKANESIQKHIEWVKKQKSGYRMKGKRMNQQEKQY